MQETRGTPRNTLPKKQKPLTIQAAAAAKAGPLRVCAYCRVSTSSPSQEKSVLNQHSHWIQAITDHDGWVLAGIYLDNGISGTGKSQRPELKRLLKDCEDGKIDLVVTKSISRFARNTADCLKMIRHLSRLGVDILFDKEGIQTGSTDGELLLTLCSAVAEEESRSISANVRWAVEKRFTNGSYKYSKAPYGYRLEGGNFVPDPAESRIVMEIFTSALCGQGSPAIAKELNRRQIPTGRRRTDGSAILWSSGSILGMLKNIAYTGDILMQKSFHDHAFKRHRNCGERPQYYMDSHHEAIIGKEAFHLTKRLLRLRDSLDISCFGGKMLADPGRAGLQTDALADLADAEAYGRAGDGMENAEKTADPRQNRYLFTGKLFCAHCEAPMKRVSKKRKEDTGVWWACKEKYQYGKKCPSRRIQEKDVENAFLTMMNKLYYAREILLELFDKDPEKACALPEENRETANFTPQARTPDEKTGEGCLQENAGANETRAAFARCAEEKCRIARRMYDENGDTAALRRRMLEIEAEEAALRRRIAPAFSMTARDKEAMRLKKAVEGWREQPRAPFPAPVFESIISRVDIGEEILFHLKCGWKLAEARI